jgi:hypothetical protein
MKVKRKKNETEKGDREAAFLVPAFDRRLFSKACCIKSSPAFEVQRRRKSQRNPFDCALPHAVRFTRWALGLVAMLEVVTAFFGFMSVSIFIAHAVDGYLSGL